VQSGEDTGEKPLYVDLVEIAEFAPASSRATDLDAAVLRSFLNGFNNLLYVLLKNSNDALKLMTSGHVAYDQIKQIAVAGDQLAAAAKRLQDLVEGAPGFRGTATILVADDEPSVRGLLQATLRQYGYTVLEASSGHEALAVCSAYPGRIHLALADVAMEPMDGYELVRKLLLARPDTKGVYMSGNYPNHARTMPGTEFLMKPHDLAQDLPQRIWQILNRP